MIKPKIDACEVIKDIRSGTSHFALMDKYRLSEKGLNSLFKKLLDLGVVKRADLGPSYKAEISASQAIKDIRSGMTRMDFMKKHRVSSRGLQSLCKKLVDSGAVDRAELEQWLVSSDQLDRWLSSFETTSEKGD